MDEEMERAIRGQDDAAMLAHPRWWPRWPFLPLKRRRDDALGLVLAVEGQLATVYLANLIWAARKGGNLLKDLIENETVERIVYTDQAALLADGWVVD